MPSELAMLMRQIETDMRSPEPPKPSFDAEQYFAKGGQAVASEAKTSEPKMKVDAFVGPHKDSTRIFIINQKNPHTNRPGEHKVMLGYKDRAHAVRDYTHSFSDGMGHKRVHSIVEMDSHQLRDWLKRPHKQPLHMAKGGEVSLASQVADVAHDLASIAHKNKLDQRQLAYLLKAASGMYLPPDRAIEYANQILTADVNGLLQRFQKYQPSMRTFARLNEMMGGKVNFMGKGHMGDQMRRMKGEEGLQRTQENIQSVLESDVVKSKPIMAKALKALNKRI